MFVNGSGQNVQSLERTAHRCFLLSFGSFDQTASEEKNFKNHPIRNKSCLWRSCLLTDRDEMSNLHKGHSIDDCYEVSVVAMFVNRSGRNEQSSQRTFHGCFLPSFGSFGQAVSEEKIFLNQPIRNKNCLWRPCLVMDHNKMCTL
jgi:hypothetical protein